MTLERAIGACPVIDIDFRPERPAFWHFASLDAVRQQGTITWNETPGGFWMVNGFDAVKEALQRPDVFTNDVVNAFSPDETVRLLPQNLNGREHVQYRHVLNPWFSPGAVKRMAPMVRERCRALLEPIVGAGRCELMRGFAMHFPTEVFLASIGLPPEDGTRLVPLVEGMFAGFFGGDPDHTAAVAEQYTGYFADVVADRVARPRDPERDFVSYLLRSEIDGVRLAVDDVQTLAMTIMLAGLDTTRSSLGYSMHHLATHPDHRQLLLDDPTRIPAAVEEFVRLYGLIIMDGRYVAQDIDFHGCPMKRGDIVWLGLASADRDPGKFTRPHEWVLDRPELHHLGFGAGGHRCLGAHLARCELAIALEEWHRRIPHYRVADPPDELRERGGQLTILQLHLEWDR